MTIPSEGTVQTWTNHYPHKITVHLSERESDEIALKKKKKDGSCEEASENKAETLT